MGRFVGIDLGTTNSAVSIIEGGEAKIIANAEGVRTTPSVVAFKKGDGEVIVGEVAKRQLVTNLDRTFSEFKRHMGSSWTTSDIDGKKYRAEELSARVLSKLKKDAETYLGEEVTDAVITVPAYFNDAERQATKTAGEIAGLKVLRIINEPTAAALAYGLEKGGDDELILIYDLGGGTFDVSLLEVGKDEDNFSTVQVLATNGDNQLGGADWDSALTAYLIDEFRKETGVDLTGDKIASARVREAAEQAKKDLSSSVETTVSLPYITMNAEGPLSLSVSVTRSKFDEITKSLLDRTETPIKDVLAEAKKSISDLSTVILVGGSTRMTAVENLVSRVTGKAPVRTVNPDEVVSLGAALQAAIVRGERDDVLLLDVTPLNLGLEVKGGLMEVLIPRNTAIPTKSSQVFTTAVANQTGVTVQVFQGQREFTKDNNKLGQFDLSVPPAPAGVPQIEVVFDIDANGIVNVTATDKGTGRAQSVTVSGSSSLSDAEVERMVKDAEAQASADAGLREVVELRNQGETVAPMARRTLAENAEFVTDELKAEVEVAVAHLEAEIKREGVTADALKTALDDVNSSLQKIGEAVYANKAPEETDNAEATSQKSEDANASSDDEEVIDAEIVE